MAKANVILLNSVLWNLREITKLAENIKSHCGDVDCTSWRYPLTSCSELEIFKLLQNNRNLDSYTYALELTYDRLLYVFNLIIKFLESADSLENFRPSKNVKRPKTLSLASVLYMIWDRIKAHVEISNEGIEKKQKSCTEVQQGDVNLPLNCSIGTQSEVCSITVCSCCEMVQEFVTQLVLEMEKILPTEETPTALAEERKKMREFLGEATNWSVMSRWLAAISKDVKTLSEKAEQATFCNRKLKKKVETGEQKTKIKIEQCEEENRKLTTRCQEFENHNQSLEEKIKEFNEEKSRMNDAIKSKNSEVQNFEKKMEDMRKSYEQKLTEAKNEKRVKDKQKEKEWKSKLDSETAKREEVEIEKKKLTETVDELKNKLEELNEQINTENAIFLNRHADLECEISNLKEEHNKLTSLLSEKQKVIDEYTKKFLNIFPDLNESSVLPYKASGNPEIDMEYQIEANMMRIEMLQSENNKLNGTLEKLKSFKG